jgi:hypothetical protein
MIGMQLLGFDAKFFRGFLPELRHVQLNVRPEILTFNQNVAVATCEWAIYSQRKICTLHCRSQATDFMAWM